MRAGVPFDLAEPLGATISEVAARLDSGELSSVELTRLCLQRAEATASLGAFIHIDEDGALSAAALADSRRAAGAKKSQLDGIPVAVKDIFLTKGIPTTCASRILHGYVPPYSATAVDRLCDVGAVSLGKLNMDEFAMGSSNEHSAVGVAKNPWNEARVPGGSSGGSAVAVAGGAAFGTLGTDTGGSIRQPASFCGVVGIKPTYGRVSRYGVIAFASSLDQVGPLARCVDDAALLLEVVAGFDPADSTSANRGVPDLTARGGAESRLDALRGLKLGVPKEYFAAGLDGEVRSAVDAAMKSCSDAGAELVEISLPHTDYAIATYYLIATAEASSNLARYDGVRYGARSGGDESLGQMYGLTRDRGFGPEVKRRIMLGTYALSAGYYDAYYRKAQQVRTLLKRDFAAAFAQVDAIVTPTTATTAFSIGEREHDPVSMYLSDVFTVSANLAGLPALSMPCGQDTSGLPIGIQLMANHWREAELLSTARALEVALLDASQWVYPWS